MAEPVQVVTPHLVVNDANAAGHSWSFAHPLPAKG